MCPFLPIVRNTNPNLPQKIAETDVPRGYIRKINFDVNLPIQTWTPHAYIPTNLSNDLGVVVGGGGGVFRFYVKCNVKLGESY